MPNLIFDKTTRADQIAMMLDDAKFEVISDRAAGMPDLTLINDIRAKKAPPTVPKVFLSNNCTFNCAYCNCRSTNDRQRYCHQPRELAKIAVDDAVKNNHGVFITSAIEKNANYTEEMIVETLRIMRKELNYGGYIHAKIMPGTDPLLIKQAGQYANRLSVNIEVAQSAGYSMIAKQKNKENILTPMQHISNFIKEAKDSGKTAYSSVWKEGKFASSQSTQLMAGSSGESDRTIMNLASAMYKKYSLKRVYYTAFQYKHDAKGYDGLDHVSTPLWRMARLYQGDRLMELYGFDADDVTPDNAPNLEIDIDPKAAWALRHMDLYPVEINRADYDALIRIPGIGTTSAQKILRMRKHCTITHDLLRQMNVPLKRGISFITCNGKFGGTWSDDISLMRQALVTGPQAASSGTVPSFWNDFG